MKLRSILVSICLLMAGVLLWPGVSTALELDSRRLVVGTSEPGVVTDHTFDFTFPSESSVGSIEFLYCTSPLPEVPCDAPPGMDASGTDLDGQSGEVGFSVVSASTNRIVISKPPAITGLTDASYRFVNVTNPTNTEEFFVRISTYGTTDASGPQTDFGAVVNATVPGVNVSTEVPPYLEFCVGLTIDGSCDSAAGDTIDLGVLSSDETSRGSSEMLAATNADFGLAITADGRTMTSGNHEIAPIENPEPSQPGESQFGINLRSNASPFIGQNPVGAGIAIPEPDYDIPNQFVFRESDVVATSPDVTDERHFTVSYIVNVSEDQQPGIYSTTVTFICTATF